MVDIVLKVTNAEVEVSDVPSDIGGAVLFRIYSPSTSKITITDSSGNEIGSMTMPSNFVEIMTKNRTDKLTAVPPILCTPVAWK